MNDQLMSLQRIFTDRLFRIPDYQRGYAWNYKEISEFWNDLTRLPDEKNHYVGVLTLEPASESEYNKWIDDLWLIKSKSYRPYYIVDGQQRLTTSIILITSIVETMKEKEIGKLNYTSINEILRRFVIDYKNEDNSCSFMFSYDKNNPSYECLTETIYKNNSYIDNSNETIYTSNLIYAKDFFKDKLKDLNIDSLEVIYKNITQHFLFNTYEISSDIDVYVTFETMNNRGKPLTYLELLKNRLIYISTLFDVSEDISARMRRDINDCWKLIYHLLGVNKDRLLQDDEFLNAHYILYFGKKFKPHYYNTQLYPNKSIYNPDYS